VRDAPSRLTSSRFACLAVHIDDEDSIEDPLIGDVPAQVRNIDATPVFTPSKERRPHWERKLPRMMKISATQSKNQLQLEVEVQTTDDARTFRLTSLVDCGASGLFIDRDYDTKHHIPTRKLLKPIPVLNVDGTPNKAGAIKEVVSLVLRH
jgi:hypothetical protein